jgi:hypothetical protein
MSLFINQCSSATSPAQNEPKTNSVEANLHRPLHIERVQPQDYCKIEQIAKKWEAIAGDKINMTNRSEDPTAWSLLSDCEGVAREIAFYCHIQPDVDDISDLYVCKDTTGEIYGIAIGYKDSPTTFHGNLLVTHPINIRCKANLLEKKRVEGVGRTFINFVETEMSKQKINTLSLVPLSSAESFYLKFGFKLINNATMAKSIPTSPNISSKL